jgi:hypothetical protein
MILSHREQSYLAFTAFCLRTRGTHARTDISEISLEIFDIKHVNEAALFAKNRKIRNPFNTIAV